jgi:hypothetical protein
VRVSNALPLPGARAGKDASTESPSSPSKQGGYLTRFAIADAAARAAPAVVNVKVSIGPFFDFSNNVCILSCLNNFGSSLGDCLNLHVQFFKV